MMFMSMRCARRARPAACAVGLAGLFVLGDACAAGFALNEMSAGAIGTAFAGVAATAEDASTIFYNPAGLARMSGRQFLAVGSGVKPAVQFSNAGSTSAARTPATGGDGGDAGGWSFVPALFYAADLTPALRWGIAFQSPFGLKTSYDEGWAGRYQALKSELKTYNFNPTLSYKLNETWSLGAGVSAEYADVELSRAIDFGSACVGSLGAANCARAGVLPQRADGRVKLDGSDWAFGFNLGVLYAPTPGSRIGVAYRSRMLHTLSGGNANYQKPATLPAALAASRSFSDTGISADLDLPDTLNLSGYMDITPKWALMADINWTNWSRFKELRVHFDNGAPDSVLREDWQNTMRFGIGAHYRYNEAWKLRAGYSYEQSPVKDGSLRTASVPDASRRIAAIGAQYKSSTHSTWDFAYAHIFVGSASINRAEPPLGGTLNGSYDNDVNIVSLQYSYSF
jgi:long-chain fatty acid transport protein